MATIKIDRFGGIQPRVHPSLLGDGMAVTAKNVKLKNGKLVPLRQPSVVKDVSMYLEGGLRDIAEASSIHAWEKSAGGIEFLLFKGMTWLANGNLASDEYDRVVISGDTGFRGGEPVVYYRNPNGARLTHRIVKSSLPAPVARRSDGDIDESADEYADIRYTYFFYTWVDSFGYESPVSEPSNEVVYNDGDVIVFGAIGTEKIEELDNAESIRVYKVVTGSETGRIQFIAEKKLDAIGYGESAFSIAIKDDDAGEIITQIESVPKDIRCVRNVPGDFYCGFSPSRQKTVMFSDIGLLYSWPISFTYDIEENIVALAVTSNSVVALTDGYPFVLSGTAPDTMSVAKLSTPAACVSERGVCVYSNSVYFVSNAGLMVVYNNSDSGTTCANLTEKIFTKDQWLEKNPASCVIGQFDGALHLFFTHDDGTNEGLMIDLNEGAAAVTTHDEVAKCVCQDNKLDKMYFVRKGA